MDILDPFYNRSINVQQLNQVEYMYVSFLQILLHLYFQTHEFNGKLNLTYSYKLCGCGCVFILLNSVVVLFLLGEERKQA